MKKKKTLIFLLLLVLIAVASFYLGKKQYQKRSDMFSLLRQEYSDNFTVKTFPIKNFLVTYAYSGKYFFDDEVGHLDKKATPRLIVQDIKNPKIESIYGVSFTNYGEEDSGNIIYPIKMEVNKDLLVGEWTISYGGSSGLKGLVLFGVKDGKLQPLTGYPFNVSKTSSINLTDKINGKRYTFSIIGDSDFSEVTDLNSDGVSDLLFADWKIGEGEAHYVPRPWNLQVFELVGNKFRVAKWWNKGEVYKTPENIGYGETDKTRLRQIFTEKLTAK